MADLRTRMAIILDDKKMTSDAKLSLLKTIQTQFDKLQKDIGLPSTGSLSTGASLTEPVVKKSKNNTVGTNNKRPSEDKDTTDQDETGETDDGDRQSD